MTMNTNATKLSAASDRMFDADSTLTYLESPRQRLFTKAVAVSGLAVYAAYLVYRALFTINTNALTFSLLVYFAELHGFLSLFFYFFQTWELRGRTVVPPPDYISVDVFITTYNEEVDLLRQTVRGAIAMQYPHSTYILDDGRRAEVKTLAEELGCGYITRDNNEHAKAGNWNNAFRQTKGQFIATFDADHVPRVDFLLRTLGFFRDPKVALVQVPQQYHNMDSLQHRVNWKIRRMYGEQDVFFDLVCPGKDNWNSAFFCGTGAVLRREALEPHGGLTTGTITEDMHTSLMLHADGWKSVYLNETLVTGLAPMDFKSFQAQRLRWAEGNLKIIRSINPMTDGRLTFPQRVCYAASMYHWTIGIPKVIFYLAPPLILFTGAYPIANFGPTFLWVYGIFLASLIFSYKVLSRGTGRLFMDEVFNMATAFTMIQAVKRLIVGRSKPSKFVVTDKRGSARRGIKEVVPHYLLLAFSLLALEWSGLSVSFSVVDDRFGHIVAAFWVLYNFVLLCLVMEMALRPPQKRETCRFTVAVPVSMRGPIFPEKAEVGMTANISAGGCELLWPRQLSVGAVCDMTITLGGQTLECQGEVMKYRGQRGAWFSHGVRFLGLTQEQIDFLNDALLNMVVPRLFDHLSQPALSARAWQQLARRITGRHHSRPRRSLVSVPVRLTFSNFSVVTMFYDVSATGLGVIVPRPVPVGASVTITILAKKPFTVEGSVVRSKAMPASLPGFHTWLLGLELNRAADMSNVRKRVLEVAA
jgi:cellulose synthase/poly-beta-1,6-N-acetylglucosamine synthase-like glycosyltransferase